MLVMVKQKIAVFMTSWRIYKPNMILFFYGAIKIVLSFNGRSNEHMDYSYTVQQFDTSFDSVVFWISRLHQQNCEY